MAKVKSTLETSRKKVAAEFVAADYDSAYFLKDPMIDSIFTSMTALAANVWALQRRADTTELLLEKHGSVTREMIEKYIPTEEEQRKISDQRDTFVAEIYDPFKESGDIAYASSFHPPSLDLDESERNKGPVAQR
jgi:hypothetical protein